MFVYIYVPNKNSLAVKKGTAKQSTIKTEQEGLISDSGQVNWNVVISIKLVRTKTNIRLQPS